MGQGQSAQGGLPGEGGADKKPEACCDAYHVRWPRLACAVVCRQAWALKTCSAVPPRAAVFSPRPLPRRFPVARRIVDAQGLSPRPLLIAGEETQMGASASAAEGGPQAAAPRRRGAGHEDADHHAQRQVQAQAAEARASEGTLFFANESVLQDVCNLAYSTAESSIAFIRCSAVVRAS